MSILSENNPITPAYLESIGFEKSGWGSPRTRAAKNTTMYDGRIELVDSWQRYHLMYFPRDWEGVFHYKPRLGGAYADVRGRIVIEMGSGYAISPILEDVIDMHVFINHTVEGAYKFISLDD